MELLLLAIPLYLFLSLIAFYKWLRLSVAVNSLELEKWRSETKLSAQLKETQKKFASLSEDYAKIKEDNERLKASDAMELA